MQTDPASIVRDLYRWRLTWADPWGTEHAWSDWCFSVEDAKTSLSKAFELRDNVEIGMEAVMDGPRLPIRLPYHWMVCWRDAGGMEHSLSGQAAYGDEAWQGSLGGWDVVEALEEILETEDPEPGTRSVRPLREVLADFPLDTEDPEPGTR